jgi:hypothetical protein
MSQKNEIPIIVPKANSLPAIVTERKDPDGANQEDRPISQDYWLRLTVAGFGGGILGGGILAVIHLWLGPEGPHDPQMEGIGLYCSLVILGAWIAAADATFGPRRLDITMTIFLALLISGTICPSFLYVSYQVFLFLFQIPHPPLVGHIAAFFFAGLAIGTPMFWATSLMSS